MRHFVAIELSDDVRETARRTADALRTRLGSRVQARWVPLENLHVTIRFIGHVGETATDEVIRAVSAPVRVAPFDLRVGACGVFPRSGPPRVIWLGLTDGLPSCAAIHALMNERLAPLGFEPENRPFSAHLTLARVKDVSRGAGPDVRRTIKACDEPAAACRVSHATLFRSQLSPTGSRYEPVARIALVP